MREIVIRERRIAILRSGMRAENKTERALRNLKETGKIQKYFRSKRFSKMDRKMIDFIIYPIEGNPIFLQVKSYLSPQQIDFWGLKEIGPGIWQKKGIYTVEVKRKENISQVEDKILKILKIEENKGRKSLFFILIDKIFKIKYKEIRRLIL
jgi:hypothetical protein